MQFDSPLNAAILLKRYKRFLADIQLPDGSITTIHCANTGAMTGCAVPGDTVWYSQSENPKRKYPLSWELTETRRGDWICVNTIRANTLAVEAIQTGVIAELQGYDVLQTEVRYGRENSRIDILLRSQSAPDCYIEVKSVTLLAQNEPEQNETDVQRLSGNASGENLSETRPSTSGQGYFPDAVTTRGQKHLRELMEVARNGKRAVLLFTVLHSGIEKVSPAHHIDAMYSHLLKEAQKEGVEVLCYKAELSGYGMKLMSKIDWFNESTKN